MASICSVEQQHLNSHFSGFPFFWQFSLQSLPTLPLSECVFFGSFLCKVCQPYRCQNAYSLAVFSAKSANPTVVRMRILWQFSLQSLPTLPLSECVFFGIFLCKVYQPYRCQNAYSLAVFSAKSANPTVVGMRILWHFSLQSLPTLPLSECVFFGIFLCKVCQPYRCRNAYSLAFFSAKSTNSAVVGMRILWQFSLQSLPTLPLSECVFFGIFLCQVYQLCRCRNAYSLAFFSAKSANPTVVRMRILWQFSLQSLPTLPLSECVFFGIFLCKVCQPYRCQNAYSLAFFSAKSANPTVVGMRILWHFSLQSLPTLPLSECVFFGIFLCKVCQPYRCRNAYSLAVFSAKSANPTVVGMRILWQFSLQSLPTLPLSECVFFGSFLCKVCQPYRFRNAYSLAVFSAKSANPTVVGMRILWQFSLQSLPTLPLSECVFFGIFLCQVYQLCRCRNAYSLAVFSAKSANPTVVGMRILWHFSLPSLPTLPFSELPFFW